MAKINHNAVCKSGLRGWQGKLRDIYENNLKVFKGCCGTWGIHTRLGFRSMISAWRANPTIRGSVIPSDLEVVK